MEKNQKTFELIQKMIKEKTGKDVQMGTNLKDLGLDSLDLLEFVVDAEKKLGVKVDDSELISLSTIKDVVDALTRKL